MNIKQNIRTVLFWIASLAPTACSNHAADKSHVNKTFADSSSTAIQETDNFTADSTPVKKDRQTKIYVQAIAEYIKAVNKKDKSGFDTLFFGKRFDFPDINLPGVINGTRICLLTPEETNTNKLLYRKSSAYVNLIGWVENDKAEFIFVTFFSGFQHQYDCFINFKYNPEQKEFELETLRFENYLYNKEGKPERITIYKDGKYVGDKPIEDNKK